MGFVEYIAADRKDGHARRRSNNSEPGHVNFVKYCDIGSVSVLRLTILTCNNVM